MYYLYFLSFVLTAQENDGKIEVKESYPNLSIAEKKTK
jgi:hypothetical protein